MIKAISLTAVLTIFLGGCASVPMESTENSNHAKQFNAPSEGKSGLYIYRDSFVGQALKKDIWVNGNCIGESAPDTFFYEQVEGDKEHKISTESEFSPNDLILKVQAGKNYFIEQFIKMGVFVGGAGLEVVDEKKGMEAVSKLDLAKKGQCSK